MANEEAKPNTPKKAVWANNPNELGPYHEFYADGVAGGNVNSETIRLVFFADKPIIRNGVADTVRTAVATAIFRRSTFRQVVQKLAESEKTLDEVAARAAAASKAGNADK